MKFSMLVLLSLLLMTSCGKKDSSSSKRVTRITEEQIASVLENQQFDCAAIGNSSCPRGITRILTINRSNPDESSVCSGFMVSPNRLVTNHHCVSTQEECENTYLAIYNGSRHVISRCASIVQTVQDYEDPNDDRRAIDYTIMETEGTYTGDTFPLANSRAQDGDFVSAWVVDHTGLDHPASPNLLQARITEFRCRVLTQTTRASLMLEECPVISGNSGSPALNLSGEVIGVIWGASATHINSATDLDIRRSIDALAAVTEMIYFADALEL